MGFRTGNAVFVNGVPATVSSWTANTIVATVPSLHTLGVSTALVADVTVQDRSTGGTTVMTQALSYAAPVTTLSLLTAPAGAVIVGQQALVPFAVQVLQADGVTPVVGETVTFTATVGAVNFAACGTATCSLHTDTNGIASTLVTPQTAGAITLQAVGVDGTAVASFTAITQVRTATAVQAIEYVAAGATVAWTPQLSLADNTASTAGVLVDWRTISGAIVGVACSVCGPTCREPRRRWRRRVRLNPARRPFFPAAPGPTYAPPSSRKASILRSFVWWRSAAVARSSRRAARLARSFCWSPMQGLIP